MRPNELKTRDQANSFITEASVREVSSFTSRKLLPTLQTLTPTVPPSIPSSQRLCANIET